MNVVAAYPTQKYLCSCLIQPFLCTVLLAPGIKKIMKMIHQDPRSVLPFSVICLLGEGGVSWFCFGAFQCLEFIFLSFPLYPWQLADRFLRWDSQSITRLLELAVQQNPGSHNEIRWTSNSVWFMYLLSWKLQERTARMLEGFRYDC